MPIGKHLKQSCNLIGSKVVNNLFYTKRVKLVIADTGNRLSGKGELKSNGSLFGRTIYLVFTSIIFFLPLTEEQNI